MTKNQNHARPDDSKASGGLDSFIQYQQNYQDHESASRNDNSSNRFGQILSARRFEDTSFVKSQQNIDFNQNCPSKFSDREASAHQPYQLITYENSMISNQDLIDQ